jgi:hypothetical protein
MVIMLVMVLPGVFNHQVSIILSPKVQAGMLVWVVMPQQFFQCQVPGVVDFRVCMLGFQGAALPGGIIFLLAQGLICHPFLGEVFKHLVSCRSSASNISQSF